MPREFQVGETFTHVRECDRYRPIYYAGVSGDYNPIHIDAEAGQAAGLGGPILQGLCTMGWAVEAVSRFVGDPGRIVRARVRFSKPVRPDDTITFRGTVKKLEHGVLTADVSATNQKGEDVLKGAVVEAKVS